MVVRTCQLGQLECIGLIMAGMLYEPEGRIEHATHDQTYLVPTWYVGGVEGVA